MNTEDVLYSIFIFLVFIVSISCFIYYSIKNSKRNKYVLDNSEKIKKTNDKINELYLESLNYPEECIHCEEIKNENRKYP